VVLHGWSGHARRAALALLTVTGRLLRAIGCEHCGRLLLCEGRRQRMRVCSSTRLLHRLAHLVLCGTQLGLDGRQLQRMLFLYSTLACVSC